MPGNEVGDRVHNFFAQENLSHGHHTQRVDDWPTNDKLWVGSQKQISVPNSDSNYNPQQSEFEIGHISQRVPVQHGFNFTQMTERPGFAKFCSQSQQPNQSGSMYGRHVFRARPDEANILGVTTDSDQSNVNQRVYSVYESQQEGVSEQISINSVREDPSDAQGSFDLFEGQPQMNSRHPGFLQHMRQQQFGFSEMQQLQQQLMLRKMHELQRQKDLRQQDARQGGISSNSMGFIHQQVNQSLNGFPVSSSNGHPNQYPHIATDNASDQKMPTYNSSFCDNQYAVNAGQGSMHGRTSVSTEGLTGKSIIGHMSGQGSNNGIKMEHLQQLKAMQQNAYVQEFYGPQDLNGPLEMVHDKSAVEATSSHGAACLDPDEEEILFGSDDNIWNAFGSDGNMDGGASNLLDGNEFASGLPSIQSGSWSALMQSAVAETSISGLGLQEEWTNLKFQNPEPPLGTSPSTNEDSGKQKTVLGDVNLPNASAYSFGSVHLADGVGMNVKYHINLGFQHHGQKIPDEDDETLHISFSGQINQHASGGTSQPNYKQNSRNPIECVDNSLQQSQSNDRKRIMHEEIGLDNGIWSVRSRPNSIVEQELGKTSIVSTQTRREGFSVYNTASVPNLGNMQGGNHSSHFSHNGHHLNYWKHGDSSVKSKRSENSEKSRPHLSKVPQVSDSSFNSSDREDLTIHEMESSSKRENSNESYSSGSPHLPESLRSFPGPKQSSSNQIGQETSCTRKFQYHPMGNLDDDVEMAGGARQSNNTQAMSLQHSRGLRSQDHGNFGHTKISGLVISSAEGGKGRIHDIEGFAKGSDDMRLKGTIPRHVPNMFAPFNTSVGLFTSDKTSQPSQNMLELLHKVDQPRALRNFNSSEHNLSSERPGPENSDGSSGGPQKSQSSNSQGFNLQLGPPSEKLSLPNHTSPRTMPAVSSNSSSQALAPSILRNKGHAELSPLLRPQETSNGEFKNDKVGIPGKTASQTLMPNSSSGLTTGFTNPRSQLQNHQMIGAKEQASANLSSNRSFDRDDPRIRQTDETCSRPLSRHPVEVCLPNAVLGLHNLQDKEAEKRGNMLSMSGASSLDSQDFASGVELSTKDSTQPYVSSGKVEQAQIMNGPPGKESVFRSISDASSVNPIATQSDLEAFGRSLKPTNFHRNYSLLNQMRAMKNTDDDPTNRVLKRLKGLDNILGPQKVAPWSGKPNENNNIVVDGSNCRATVSPGDFHALSFSMPADNVELNVSSQPGNVPSKDERTFGHNQSQSYISSNMTSVKAQHSHISPQMAPSWFDQFGTLKTDQMLPRGVDTIKTMEQPSSFVVSQRTHTSKEQTSAASDTGLVCIISKNPPSLAIEKFSSPPLTMNADAQNLETLKPKKRKHIIDDFHPWLKEVTGGFKILQDIRNAAVHWSKAANLLIEKFEDNCEVVEGIRTMARPKRRLVLTMQLMQQLLHSPPTRILSTNANSNYESMAYYVARMTLRDACNLVSSATSYSSVSHGGTNSLSDRNKKTERNDEHLSEVMQDFMSKARQLENDFMRLDMRASILDLRLECQELEKFSVINRFAKFHVRGQADGAEASSSSDAAANAPPHQPYPQRYVIAVPLPKNLPHRVQCLSL